MGIGLDLARAAARLVMLDWDQQFLQLAEENAINYYHFSRYVDDTANGTMPLAPRCEVERAGGEDDSTPPPD